MPVLKECRGIPALLLYLCLYNEAKSGRLDYGCI